jgi:hypothetical protein
MSAPTMPTASGARKSRGARHDKYSGGQYQKTEKSVPSIAIRDRAALQPGISDADLETRDFSSKRRPRVSEHVSRPPRVSGTKRALRVAVSNAGWSREENASGAIKPSIDGSRRSVAENGVRETCAIKDRAALRAE